MLRLRGRLKLCRAVGCACRWAGGYSHPDKQLTTTTYGEVPGPLIGSSPTRQREGSPYAGNLYDLKHLSICSFCTFKNMMLVIYCYD